MSNEHIHPIFGLILESMERNNIATANAVQQAEADAKDAQSWRWLQAEIDKSGGVSIWPKKHGVQKFGWGTPSEPDAEEDEPMTAEGWRDIGREMRDDDDRAGIA